MNEKCTIICFGCEFKANKTCHNIYNYISFKLLMWQCLFSFIEKERVHFIYSTRNKSRLKADIFQHLYQITALNQLLRCRFLSNTLYSITHTAEFLLYKMEQRENSLRLAITVVGFPILK